MAGSAIPLADDLRGGRASDGSDGVGGGDRAAGRGRVVLAGMAELFAEHAVAAGGQLSGLAVGLLLAGAELEELIIVVLAVVRGQRGIAVGMRSART